ncbi:methyl-accepting chemotaxis protein [Thalassospira australica]|uniref:methyl-accepting chemotaxis protein n=1 Tax=Thalassospira australica TaxID=1528106 RepID=UPI00384CEEFE
MSFLKRFKISHKVYGGFGIILALLVLISVLGVVSLNSANNDFIRYRQIALESNQAARVQANLLEARVAVKDYLLTDRASSRDQVLQRIEQAIVLNNELFALADDDNVRAIAEKAGTDLLEYQAAFQQVVGMPAGNADRNQLVTQTLDVIGPRVAADLENLKLGIKQVQDTLGPHAARTISNAVLISEILAVVAVVIGGLAAWLIGTGISNPIRKITTAMTNLAEGDKASDIPGQDHKDEIGDMAKAVLVFKENMIKAEHLAAQEVEAQKQREARAKVIEKLTNDFDADVSIVLKSVSSAATEMQATATSMTATAEETSRQSTVVAAAAEQASNNVQTVASASEELSASISEISQQVNQSAQVANKAVTEAESTNAQVRGLAEAAQKIGDVVGLISDIAAQTNLLALNATIEAARAGEAGKGFAVVAAEVKNLANATSKATDEITAQITGIQAETEGAVVAIDSIGKTIAEISEIAAAIASAVEQQGAATEEINRNVQQASAGTSEVTENIHGVNEAAASTGSAAEQVLSASGELSEQAETLRQKVETFLSGVKNA